MQTPKPNRSKLFLQILLVAVFILAAILLFRALGGFQKQPVQRTVTFKVTATGGSALISFKAGPESIDPPATVSTPWQKRMKLNVGEQVYVTGSNNSGFGTVACQILVDGQTWQSDLKEAPLDGVACGGYVP